jgi:tripeptidyl-peptidase-1
MVSRSLLLLGVLVAVANSNPIAFRAEPSVPQGWNKLAEAAKDVSHTLKFSLYERNLDQLGVVALEVSNPNHEKYGQHLTHEEIEAMTAPAAEDIATVTAWLANFTDSVSVSKELITVKCTIAVAEQILSTTFSTLFNTETRQRTVRASDIFLPEAVAKVVLAVYGTHGLPLPPSRTQQAPSDMADVTPAVIESTYKISGVTITGSTKNRQAVAEFQGQTMANSDLVDFFQKYVPGAKTGDDKVYAFKGDPGTGGAGIEASLDIQYIMGVAPGLLTEFWYQKNFAFCDDLKAWTALILSDSNGPNVHSVSYGWQGDLSKLGCTAAQVTDIDAQFKKIAASGVSIIFASGDSGSGWDNQKLWPSWPASSPWITSVGATRFIGQQVGNAEMASDQFGSGGGFSFQFTAFKEQQASIATYLQNAPQLPTKGTWPPAGRGTPEVSALGEGYSVYANGQVTSVGGTSASTPAFAGIVSLLNEARLAQGKAPLGYLNPFIYANADVFTDITVGTDAIGRGGQQLAQGFNCTAGWDPATGMGTPIFPKLLAAALAA